MCVCSNIGSNLFQNCDRYSPEYNALENIAEELFHTNPFPESKIVRTRHRSPITIVNVAGKEWYVAVPHAINGSCTFEGWKYITKVTYVSSLSLFTPYMPITLSPGLPRVSPFTQAFVPRINMYCQNGTLQHMEQKTW